VIDSPEQPPSYVQALPRHRASGLLYSVIEYQNIEYILELLRFEHKPYAICAQIKSTV